MSMHKSLRLKNALVRQRSVLSRWERIVKLKDLGKWQEGDKVLGLPKVRTKFKVRSKRLAKKEAAEAEKTAATTPGAEKPAAEKAPAGKAAAGKSGKK